MSGVDVSGLQLDSCHGQVRGALSVQPRARELPQNIAKFSSLKVPRVIFILCIVMLFCVFILALGTPYNIISGAEIN